MSEEPKIVVDDDWKSQVEKEKDQLQKEADDKASNEQTQEQTGNSEEMEMPPASFSMLVTTLAMQAGVSLGQMPDPSTGQPQINKPVAKHFIDTLALLEDKTKGNLDKEEAELLTTTIHQLRIAFITMPDSLPEQGDENPGDENKSQIELP